MTPPLGAEAMRSPPGAQRPIAVVGKPALTWDGTSWVLVWRDTRRQWVGTQSHVYAARWDGGAETNPPWGFPVLGNPSPLTWDDVEVVSSSMFSLVVFENRSRDGGVDLVGVPTSGTRTVTGAWGGTYDVSGGLPVDRATVAVAASQTQALVAWLGGGEIHLRAIPGMVRSSLSVGPNASSLSVGEADGGFLVAWVDSVGRGVATLVDPVMLVPGVNDQLSATGTTGVQVVSQANERLVTTARATGEFRLQSFSGSSWAPTVWPNSTNFTPLTVVTGTTYFSVHRGSASFNVFAAPRSGPLAISSVQFVSTTSRPPVALAHSESSAVSLLVEDRRVFGQPLFAESNPTLTVVAPLPTALLSAPLWQRAPSAIWVDEEQAFLVAWDEEQLDGGSGVMSTWLQPGGQSPLSRTAITGVPFFALGARPVLLRGPSGTSYGVQLRTGTGGQRAVFDLVVAGSTLSVGMQRTLARTLDWAIRGAMVDLQWGRGAINTAGYVGNELTPRLTFTGAPPTCAAALGGKLVLASHESTGLTVASVPDAPTGGASYTPPQLVPVPAAQGPVCATSFRVQAAGGPRDDLALAWRDGNALVLHTMPTATLQNVEQSVPSQPGGDPLVVDTSAGPLVVWVGRQGVDAVVLQGAALSSVTSLGGGLDVENLSVASSPLGVAAVVWDAFVADAGARQVMMRLVGAFDAGPIDAGVPDAGPGDAGMISDGGTVSDAGMIGDGGTVSDAGPMGDAGVTSDGGIVTPFDAGVPDSGVLDSGATNDAGALDAGLVAPVDGGSTDAGVPPVTLTFVPACGCQGGPGAFGVLLALVLLRRRVAR